MSPESIVQRQLEAYNDHDVERFAALYADDVEIFRMPATEPALRGRAQLAAYYAANRFNVPGLRAEVVNRMAFGDKVIDHERITGLAPDPVEVAAVYEVRDGLIRRAWFYAGA